MKENSIMCKEFFNNMRSQVNPSEECVTDLKSQLLELEKNAVFKGSKFATKNLAIVSGCVAVALIIGVVFAFGLFSDNYDISPSVVETSAAAKNDEDKPQTTTAIPSDVTEPPAITTAAPTLPQIVPLPPKLNIPFLQGFIKELNDDYILMEVEWGRDENRKERFDVNGMMLYVPFSGATMSMPVQGMEFNDLEQSRAKNNGYEISVWYNGDIMETVPIQVSKLVHIAIFHHSTE